MIRVHRLVASLLPMLVAIQVPVVGATRPPAPQDLARTASAVLQQASTDVGRLEADVAARESAWRTMFVGQLKRGDTALREEEVFEPLRHAQQVVDDLRREIDGLAAARADAASLFDRAADVLTRAALGRWQLAKDEATLAVDLARQRYDAVAVDLRRQRNQPGQRDAATRREREARDAATRSVGVARDRLQRAREAALEVLGALKERARQVGRAETSNVIVGQIEAELIVTPADASGIPAVLDRFLDSLTIVFESAAIDERAETLTLAGAFSPVDIARIGVTASARAITFVRMVPSGIAFEQAPELAYGRAIRVQVEFDADPASGAETVVVEWGAGADAGRISVPIRLGTGRVHQSELIEVWPAGRVVPARPAAVPPPAASGRGRGLGGIDFGGAAGAPVTTPAPVGSQVLDERIATLSQEIERLSRDATLMVDALAGPREVRDRAAGLRERVDAIRRTFAPPPPQAGSAAANALSAFRARWHDLAEPAWVGQPPSEPLAADRFAELAARFRRPPCRGLEPRPGPVRLIGQTWACVADAFFADLVAAEGELERITAEVRQRAMTALDQSTADVAAGLQPRNAPAPTPIARGVWLQDMTKRLRLAELEAARLQLIDLERRRSLTADPASAYGWFLKWSARTESAEAWRWAPHVIRIAARQPVRATYGGVTVEVRVEAEAPVDTAGFFARALYSTHDQDRRLASDSGRAIDRELRDYASALERQYPAAGAGQYEDDEMARLRRQAVDVRRQALEAAAADRLTSAGARLQRARDEALAAIGGGR